MKKYITRLLMISLCVVFLFSVSCTNDGSNPDITETMTSEETDDGDPFTFSSVSDLKKAIKKNPKYYNDHEITVQGTIFFKEGGLFLADFNGLSFGTMDEFYLRQDSSRYIAIVVPDDVLATVLEKGDYIKLNGTVRISEGEIYLDGCEYIMIATSAERSQ